jgi:hypothetical protein
MRLPGAGVAPVRGGTYFICRRKESEQRRAGSHRQSLTITHGPQTSPCFAPQRADSGSLPTYSRSAPPASCVRTAAGGIECFRPPCGKLMSVVAPHAETLALCSLRCASRHEGLFSVWREGLHIVCRKWTLDVLGLRAKTQKLEVGEAFNQCDSNEHGPVRCRATYGDVESPWVSVKDWRCEPAFFAYFLCGRAAAKKVGAAPHRGNARAA